MKSKKILYIIVIILVISLLCYFGTKHYNNKMLQKQKKELKEIIEKYGILEKESIADTISKFNEQINASSTLNIANEKYLTIENKQYWYGLDNGIYCFIIPEKFTGSKDKDTTKIISIYYEEESNNSEKAIEYVKYLIKANNDNITEEETKNLITQALENSSKNLVAISGKGITLGIYKSTEYTEYQIARLYNF